MSAKRILIIGCGKIGLRVAQLLSRHHQVWGLSRSAPKEHNSPSANLNFISADVSKPELLEDKLPENLDYLIYCVAPTGRNEAAYKKVYLEGMQNIISALKDASTLQRLYFISSTSVYHQNDHTFVDEQSPAIPNSFSGRILLETEDYCRRISAPSTIIRFSGIYGASRSRLIDQVKDNQAKLGRDSRLTNRIHEDDCVGFIFHLIQQDILGIPNEPIYLASDSEPVALNDVIKFIASHLGVEHTLAPSDDAEKRRAGNKKCSNKAMLKSGYRLQYPSYREGYLAMLALL